MLRWRVERLRPPPPIEPSLPTISRKGRNVHTEMRWGSDNADRYRRYSEELVALEPA